MKKAIFIIVVAISIVSCGKYNGLRVSDLRQYFADSLMKDSAITVDSFSFAKMDTITAKAWYKIMYDATNYFLPTYQESIKATEAAMNSTIGMDSFVISHGRSVTFHTADSLSFVDAKIQYQLALQDRKSLDSLINKSDSIVTLAYIAECSYQIKYKNLSTRKDTAFINLNKNFHITSPKHFYKLMPPFAQKSDIRFFE